MANLRGRATYIAAQSTRVAFFAAQYRFSRRAARRALGGEEPSYEPAGQLPGKAGMRKAILELFRRDLANIEAGLYPAPPLVAERPDRLLAATRAFLRDVPAVVERRRRRAAREVRAEAADSSYPAYYLQNFHYQSGGWLSEESARIYDHQVEVLFSGTADAMRRQALVPLKRRFAGQRRPRPRLLDLGTGTGRFLREIKRTLPQARLSALEPSPAYRRRARRAVPRARVVSGFVEAMPVAEERMDAVTAAYLFHELPPGVRRAAAREIARVLRPGGTLVMVDSLQTGDVASFDGLLEAFPQRFHEPYYQSYLETDFAALFRAYGLRLVETRPVFLSKLLVFEKPG